MKTGEARGIYSSVLKSYNEQKFKLSKQREELKERMESTPDGKTRYADEAATLELKYNAVAEKQDEYQNYVNQLMAQWEGKFNSVVAKQQGEAAKDYGEEMGKIMTVARRLMHGDQVPMQDEKKLMEYDKDLYIMAKNAGMMARLEKRKKYDSLWEDEEKKEHEDPMEAADAEEAFTAGPEVVSVESVMEAAAGETESPSRSDNAFRDASAHFSHSSLVFPLKKSFRAKRSNFDFILGRLP